MCYYFICHVLPFFAIEKKGPPFTHLPPPDLDTIRELLNISLLKAIYNQTCYQFTHRGVKHSVKTHRGVRQGCRAAPCLWLLYLAHLTFRLAQETSWTWIQIFNTVFADDWICHTIFHNTEELAEHIKNIGWLFDILADYDLCINVSKTVSLIKVAGPDVAKLNKRFLHRTREGVYLLIPRKDGSFTHVRLVQQHMYLGICLKFGAYQAQTLQHRLQAARNVSFLLNRWLRGKGGLTKQQRVRLWLQCVFTSLLHGLSHVGLSANQIAHMDSWCMTQLRHLHRQPVHLDHISHLQFLEQHRLPDPLKLFEKRLHGVLKREQLRAQQLSPQDILSSWQSSRTQQVLLTLQSFLHQRCEGNVPPNLAPFQCIYCDTSFSDAGQLRRHQTRVHGYREGALRIFDSSRDTISGVPTCSRCHHAFTNWRNLKRHVALVCTFEPVQDPADLKAFKAVQQTFRKFAGHGLDNLPNQQDLLAKFRHRCAVYNQFHTSDKLLKAHWKLDHSTAFVAHDDLYQEFMTQALMQQPDDTPCIYCDKRTKRKHHDCILLRNLAILAASDDLTDIPICATPERLLKCTLCDRSFLTQNGLTMHMHKQHNAADVGTVPFLVERDCLPNAKACAHCGQAFETMTSVERHIRSGNCPEFDANLSICTMMTINEDLKCFVENDNLTGLLKDTAMLQLLYLQCGLCQQKFRYRGQCCETWSAPAWGTTSWQIFDLLLPCGQKGGQDSQMCHLSAICHVKTLHNNATSSPRHCPDCRDGPPCPWRHCGWGDRQRNWSASNTHLGTTH